MVSRPISIYMSIALWCIFMYYTSFDVYCALSRGNVSQNTPEGWALFQCDSWLPRNSQHPWFFLRPLNVMSTTNHIVTALNSRKSNLIIICMVSYPYKTRRCIIPFTNLIECAFNLVVDMPSGNSTEPWLRTMVTSTKYLLTKYLHYVLIPMGTVWYQVP
jgi:hypothetical protein